ncbi:MAG: helicase-related protein, partial [Deltaproteobacteria bacterium]
KLGIPAHRYHGKMTAKDRNSEQELFMKPGRRTLMVATSAFGLGIDKPDIRYVAHAQSPASLEQYVQEAGRSGRDGNKANCILLHDAEEDRKTHEALLSRSRLRPEQLYRLGDALAAWAGEGRKPDLKSLALSAELGERTTNALLVPIEEACIVRFNEEKLVEVLVPIDEIEAKVRALAGQFANLRTQDSRRLDSLADYAKSDICRAVYLRSYFGEDDGEACGLCDICRGRPERPATFFQAISVPKRRGRKKGRGGGRQRSGGGRVEASAEGKSAEGQNPKRRRRRRRGRRGGGANEGTKPAPDSGSE